MLDCLSLRVKPSPMLTYMHIMMDQLPAQGMGALNTSLSPRAELGPLERNEDRDFLKAQIISKC